MIKCILVGNLIDINCLYNMDDTHTVILTPPKVSQ